MVGGWGQKGEVARREVAAPAWASMPPGTFWMTTLDSERTRRTDGREQRPRVKLARFLNPLGTMVTRELCSFNNS